MNRKYFVGVIVVVLVASNLTPSWGSGVTTKPPEIVDVNAKEVEQVLVGQQVFVKHGWSMVNETDYVAIMQVKDREGFVAHLSWVEGHVKAGEDVNPLRPWAPDYTSLFAVELFVWTSLEEPIPLTPKVATYVQVFPFVKILKGSSNPQQQDYFSPRMIKVVLGVNSTIVWLNEDLVGRGVAGDRQEFNSGLMGSNQTWSHTFTKAGVYGYHGEPGPWMKGTIIVLPGNYIPILDTTFAQFAGDLSTSEYGQMMSWKPFVWKLKPNLKLMETEEAEKIAREYMGQDAKINQEYYAQSDFDNGNMKKYYVFYFENPRTGSNGNINIDSVNGQVLVYSESFSDLAYGVSTPGERFNIVKKFLKEHDIILPYDAYYDVSEESYPTPAYVSFVHFINGTKLEHNRISFNIDTQHNRVVAFTYNWNWIDKVPTDGLIAEEKAVSIATKLQKYYEPSSVRYRAELVVTNPYVATNERDKDQLMLCWKVVFSPSNIAWDVPTTFPINLEVFLDATTGKLLSKITPHGPLTSN